MLERSCPIVFLSSVGLSSPASVQVVKASGETVQSFRRKMEGSRTRFQASVFKSRFISPVRRKMKDSNRIKDGILGMAKR